MRFHGGGAAWNHVAMEQAIADSGLRASTRSRTSAPASSWGPGGPSTRTIVEAADITRSKGPEEGRTVRGAQGHVLDGVGDALDLVQDQGRELLDLLGLRDLQSLRRGGLRANSHGQAGRDVRGRLRGARLDALGAVRRHGGDVVGLQRDARARVARLRQESRRIRDFGRRRRAGARGLRAGEGPRREDLRRDRRLRRDLGRPRHGRARRARARRAACARRFRR